MANEIVGLINVTTGAGVANADTRYQGIMTSASQAEMQAGTEANL